MWYGLRRGPRSGSALTPGRLWASSSAGLGPAVPRASRPRLCQDYLTQLVSSDSYQVFERFSAASAKRSPTRVATSRKLLPRSIKLGSRLRTSAKFSGYSDASVASPTPARMMPAVHFFFRNIAVPTPAAPLTSATFQFSIPASASRNPPRDQTWDTGHRIPNLGIPYTAKLTTEDFDAESRQSIAPCRFLISSCHRYGPD